MGTNFLREGHKEDLEYFILPRSTKKLCYEKRSPRAITGYELPSQTHYGSLIKAVKGV